MSVPNVLMSGECVDERADECGNELQYSVQLALVVLSLVAVQGVDVPRYPISFRTKAPEPAEKYADAARKFNQS